MCPSPLRKRCAFSGAAVLALALVLPALLGACRSTSAVRSGTAADTWADDVAYEIFVQSFADSDGNGIGDLRGATARLDYLRDLGVHAVWLMPINPSPSYHKYDVTDYTAIHPDYGTMDDFRAFVREAHARGIKVIIDLVVNHTGSQHPWFKAALADSTSRYHDFYVWETTEHLAAIGETKAATGDSDNRNVWVRLPGQSRRFYAYFGGGMPDLNYDNPAVRAEIIRIGQFWLRDVGIDGFRLDAAKHIYPDDRAADSHAWWREFRAAMQAVKPDVYLVGEVWDRAEVVAPYFKGLNAVFNFDLGYAITDAVRTGQADTLTHRLTRIRNYYASIDPGFLDAIFLTNHDQNRIMSVLGGDANRASMAAALLLTLPGTPYLYYGEELGMRGRKPDPFIREPLPWGGDAAPYQTRWIAARHSVPDSVATAAAQSTDPGSLLNFYRRLIRLRNEHPALSLGGMATADPGTPGLASYVRGTRGDSLWVVHNLTAAPKSLTVPARLRPYGTLLFQSNEGVTRRGETLTIPAYTTAVLRRK